MKEMPFGEVYAAHLTEFENLKGAILNNKARLIECKKSSTDKKVPVVVAEIEINDTKKFIPLAELFSTDPYRDLTFPRGFEPPLPTPEIGTLLVARYVDQMVQAVFRDLLSGTLPNMYLLSPEQQKEINRLKDELTFIQDQLCDILNEATALASNNLVLMENLPKYKYFNSDESFQSFQRTREKISVAQFLQRKGITLDQQAFTPYEGVECIFVYDYLTPLFVLKNGGSFFTKNGAEETKCQYVIFNPDKSLYVHYDVRDVERQLYKNYLQVQEPTR